MQPSNALDPNDSQYEELLALWADLEAGLATLLASPSHVHGFTAKVAQYHRWMRDLLTQDTDIALYLLFQLAATSTVGYSASHALVCAVLCDVTAATLRLPDRERDSLVRAAMTMNLVITQLQDELAACGGKPGATQQLELRQHGPRGSALLGALGVNDALWLDVVAGHHEALSPWQGDSAPAGQRLGFMLQSIDRYAAIISPRGSRAGRSAVESLQTLARSSAGPAGLRDRLTGALVESIGFYPPGTFVRLAGAETAVVLRRGANARAPVLAVLGDASGNAYAQPRLQRNEGELPAIEAAVAAHAVGLTLNHRTLVQLGLYSARQRQRAADFV